MTFGERLRQLRRSRNLTQQDIAEVLNVGRPTIAGYETKGQEPDYDKLTKLANYFSVSVDYLLCGSDNKTDADSNNRSKITLTVKEQEKLDEKADLVVENLKVSLSKNKDHLDDRDLELLQAGIKTLIETMTLKNKEKYTPKIYRK